MADEGFKRKLTAILSADVAGYSRLMAEDETFTVKTIAAYREVIASLIKQHRGRVVDSPGDNVLSEFSSVVDAVQCAVAVQNEIQTRNADLPDNRKMEFRIGVNLGEGRDHRLHDARITRRRGVMVEINRKLDRHGLAGFRTSCPILRDEAWVRKRSAFSDQLSARVIGAPSRARTTDQRSLDSCPSHVLFLS